MQANHRPRPRVLWLTREAPDPPRGGHLLYTKGLLAALAGAVEVHLIAHRNPDAPAAGHPHDLTWAGQDVVEPPSATRAGSLLSRLPSDACRLASGGFRRALRTRQDEPWDWIVIDHAAMGGCLRAIPCDARLLYVAHNVESVVRPHAARSHSLRTVTGLARRYDALKFARLEHAILRRAHAVVAISSADQEALRTLAPGRPVHLVRPPYLGRRVEARTITAETPRRALMLGSFDWVVKQGNLLAFMAVADPVLAAAGVTVDVVGRMPAHFRRQVEGQARSFQIVGEVEEIEPYLERARIGLVAEALGGGFKLKTLDYVFHRVPVFGLADAIVDLPVKADGMCLAATMAELVAAVARAIDDLPRMNRMQAVAFDACQAAFDLEPARRDLLAAMGVGAPGTKARAPGCHAPARRGS